MFLIDIDKDKQGQKSNLLKTLLILTLAYIAMTITHDGFLALLPFIREEFVLTRTQVGYYSTSFFLSSATMAIITGSIVDRLGPKTGILLGVSCLGFIYLLFGFSPTYWILLLLALIAGLGHSIITPSVNKAVMIEAPPEKRASFMGIMQSGLGVGGFAGASLLPFLGEYFGWRIVIQAAGIFALLMGFLIYKFYHRKKNNNKTTGPQTQNESSPSLKDNLCYFLIRKQFLLICLFGMIIASSVGAVISHFAVFLYEVLHMSRAAAGLGLGVFQIGGIIGRPVWGLFSDRFLKGNRSGTLFLVGLFTGIIFLIIGYLFRSPQISFATVYIFSFVLGFSAAGWPGVFFITAGEFAGEARAGGATGIALLFIRIGMLIAPPIFGLIADFSESYHYSWLLFGGIIIISTVTFYGLMIRFRSDLST